MKAHRLYIAIAVLLASCNLALAQLSLLPQGNTGIASRYPGDIDIRSHPNVFWADDFENYEVRDDLKKVYNTVQRNVHPSSQGYAGSQGIVMVLKKSTSERSNSLAKIFNMGRDVIFMRVYHKYDSRFNIRGSSHNGFGVSSRYYVDGRSTAGMPANGTNKYLVNLEHWLAKDGSLQKSPGEINLYVYHPLQRTRWGDHFFPDGKILPYSSRPHIFGKYFVPRPDFIPERGRWYCYELMVKANTPGKKNGRIAFWVDGRLRGDFPNLRLRDVSELTMDRIHLSLHSKKSTRENKKWLDNLVVATSYIGPMAGVPTSSNLENQ